MGNYETAAAFESKLEGLTDEQIKKLAQDNSTTHPLFEKAVKLSEQGEFVKIFGADVVVLAGMADCFARVPMAGLITRLPEGALKAMKSVELAMLFGYLLGQEKDAE